MLTIQRISGGYNYSSLAIEPEKLLTNAMHRGLAAQLTAQYLNSDLGLGRGAECVPNCKCLDARRSAPRVYDDHFHAQRLLLFAVRA